MYGAASILWRLTRAPATGSAGPLVFPDENSRGDVGIWRETYLVRAGQYEAIYSGMPLTGLAKAGARGAVTAETDSARERLRVDAS